MSRVCRICALRASAGCDAAVARPGAIADAQRRARRNPHGARANVARAGREIPEAGAAPERNVRVPRHARARFRSFARVLECCVFSIKMLRARFRSFAPPLRGSIWVYFGYILGLFGVYFGYMLGLFWVYSGYILGICWVCFGSALMARMPMAMVGMMTATMESPSRWRHVAARTEDDARHQRARLAKSCQGAHANATLAQFSAKSARPQRPRRGRAEVTQRSRESANSRAKLP